MNNKKIIILVLFVIFFISCLILIFVLRNKKTSTLSDEDKPITSLVQIKDSIEVYDNVKLSDIVNITNGTLKSDDEIDTSTVRDMKLTVHYYDNRGKEANSLFDVSIVDTKSPYIGLAKAYTHVIGNEFNLEKNVMCGDNYTVKPKCYIKGDYDLNNEKSYDLTFVAEDESGNITEKNFKLNVVKKKNSSSSSSPKISFNELKKRIPSGSSMMIDISKWQENVNWKKVKESGIDYVMLRVGTQKGIGGDSVIDSYFEKNVKGALENGLKVGVYYYSYAQNTSEAYEQAKWVVDKIKDYNIELPVAFDWECFNMFNSFNMNFHTLNVIADSFLEKIEKSGYKSILYGSKNYLENVWTYLDYDVWLAHYTENTTYGKEYIMWQFTNMGSVPGVNGGCDVGIYYNNKVQE